MKKTVKNISAIKVKKRAKPVPFEFAALNQNNSRTSVPLPTKDSRRDIHGRMPIGGCVYNGQSSVIWGPVADVVKISHGPIGCGVYSQPTLQSIRRGVNGIDAFSPLCFSTDYQERDIVYGGDNKLAQAIDEVNTLFPLANAVSILAECPIGLIGDDIGAVAKEKTNESGKTIVPVLCEGYRGGDAVGDLRKAMLYAWQSEGEKYADAATGPYDVALICTESNGEVQVVRALLEALGLNVIAQWPGGSSTADLGRLCKARLLICALPNWKVFTEVAADAFDIPALYVCFMGPDTCDESLRSIAGYFDPSVRERAEAIIAANAPRVQATIARYRPMLENKLYMSMHMFTKEDACVLQSLGLRLGALYQGWTDESGAWITMSEALAYVQRSLWEVERVLDQAKPDLLTPMGQDQAIWRKSGIPQIGCFADAEQGTGPYWGYTGFDRLAADLAQTLASSFRQSVVPPWHR